MSCSASYKPSLFSLQATPRPKVQAPQQGVGEAGAHRGWEGKGVTSRVLSQLSL